MEKSLFVFACTLFIWSCSIKDQDTFESEHFNLIQVSDGVYGCIHKPGGKAICNVGVIDNGESTIIFDSFLSPDVAEELVQMLQTLDVSPVRYVVNSHFHNDHIRGNQVFSDRVRIISTSITKELIKQEEPLQIAFEKDNAPARFAYYDSLDSVFKGDTASRAYQIIQLWKPYYETLMKSHLEVETRLPDMLVESTLSLHGPKRRVQLITKGRGHSDSDLILYLPDDDIVFTGDLTFHDRHPYVGHGNISDWKQWLDFLKTLQVATVVPGHGEIGGPEIIAEMKTYLNDLESTVQDLMLSNILIDDMDSIAIPEKYKDWWFERFYLYNVSFVYDITRHQN